MAWKAKFNSRCSRCAYEIVRDMDLIERAKDGKFQHVQCPGVARDRLSELMELIDRSAPEMVCDKSLWRQWAIANLGTLEVPNNGETLYKYMTADMAALPEEKRFGLYLRFGRYRGDDCIFFGRFRWTWHKGWFDDRRGQYKWKGGKWCYVSEPYLAIHHIRYTETSNGIQIVHLGGKLPTNYRLYDW